MCGPKGRSRVPQVACWSAEEQTQPMQPEAGSFSHGQQDVCYRPPLWHLHAARCTHSDQPEALLASRSGVLDRSRLPLKSVVGQFEWTSTGEVVSQSEQSQG